jgi:hypothetical protein
MIKELIKLADHLDKKGFYKEANYVDNLLKSGGRSKEWLERRKRRDREQLIDRMELYFTDPRVPELTKSVESVLGYMSPRHFFIGIEIGWFSDNNISKEDLKPFVKNKLVELADDLSVFPRIYRSMKKNIEPFEGLVTLEDIREIAKLRFAYKFKTHSKAQKDFIALFEEGLFSKEDLTSYFSRVDNSHHDYIPELLLLDERIRYGDLKDNKL